MKDTHTDLDRKNYSEHLIWEAAVRHARIKHCQKMVKEERPLNCNILAKRGDVEYIKSLARPSMASMHTKLKGY